MQLKSVMDGGKKEREWNECFAYLIELHVEVDEATSVLEMAEDFYESVIRRRRLRFINL